MYLRLSIFSDGVLFVVSSVGSGTCGILSLRLLDGVSEIAGFGRCLVGEVGGEFFIFNSTFRSSFIGDLLKDQK